MLRKLVWVIGLMLAAGAAHAADQSPLRIAVLNDLSSVYSDYQGIGSVIAAQMAVDDFGGKVAGRPVEVLSADHQMKPDVGAAIARRWFDNDNVQLILDVPNSSVALAVNEIAREKNKVLIGSGAGTSLLTGEKCTPNTVHWTYDTWALAHGVAKAVVQQGGKKWFFITSDYAFGHDLEKQASDVVKANGGEVIGAVRHPLGTSDYASFVLQAQASGADVIGFATPGGDLSNLVKQANEFGLAKTHRLVGLIFAINNVESIGLASSQGVVALNATYWDLNDATRAWSKRFQARHPRKVMPNDQQMGVYSAVLHYLKAVEKLGGEANDGARVVAQMKQIPTDDPLFGQGVIRPDGRKIHQNYILRTKRPEDVKGQWDYFDVIATVPAAESFRPMSEGHCPLVQ
ncbi:ABC transporter substrate-binding protein [Bradyrhizobium sp. 2TAF24]|uniref:ABC transporter substrate-binding protein n=1 Tax=Bradyrhizobium sp. 2TAF24 TaxID=3233011 RepID=UPI003F8FAB09